MACPHKSFGCYNRNYLLGAGIKSSGILVDNKNRLETIRLYHGVKLLCDLWIIKKYNLYRYLDLSKKLNKKYEDLIDLYSSKEFKFIKLLGDDRLNIPKILVVIQQECNSPEERHGLSDEKLFNLFGDQNLIDSIHKMLDEFNSPNLVSLKRRRGLFGGIAKIFEKYTKYDLVINFNEKYNVENARAVVNKINYITYSSVIKGLGNYDSSKNYYEEIKDKIYILPEDKRKMIINPEDLETWKVSTSYKDKLLSFYKSEQKLYDFVDKKFLNFSDYVKLELFYNNYHKFDEFEEINFFEDIKDRKFTYDNRLVDQSELYRLVDSYNFNSPAIKTNVLLTGGTRFLTLRHKMCALNLFRTEREGMDKAEIIKLFDEDYNKNGINVDNGKHAVKFNNMINFPNDGLTGIAYRMYRYYSGCDNLKELIFTEKDESLEAHEMLKFFSAYYISASIQKQLSGYIDGQLLKGLRKIYQFEEDYSYTLGDNPEWYNYRLYVPDWNIMGVTTKRWSAGIHTWRQGTDVFHMLKAEKDSVAIYFDISQAEVRFSAFASGDPTMLDYYDKGVDIYVETAKEAYPNKDKAFWKSRRTEFKSIVLGLLYGRGAQSITDQTGLPIEETRRLIKIFRNKFPVLTKFIEEKKQYARDHNGKIETFLGDRLYCEQGRESTCGINYFIQNSASTVLGEGFENLYENCYRQKTYISPKVVVHDSYTVTTHVTNFFKVIEDIEIHFRQYLWEKYKVFFKYDLITMANFRDKVEFKVSDNNTTLDLSGSDLSINSWLEVFKKYYDFDYEETYKGESLRVVDDILSNGNLKQYAFYPDNNYNKPIPMGAKLTNIRRK